MDSSLEGSLTYLPPLINHWCTQVRHVLLLAHWLIGFLYNPALTMVHGAKVDPAFSLYSFRKHSKKPVLTATKASPLRLPAALEVSSYILHGLQKPASVQFTLHCCCCCCCCNVGMKNNQNCFQPSKFTLTRDTRFKRAVPDTQTVKGSLLCASDIGQKDKANTFPLRKQVL